MICVTCSDNVIRCYEAIPFCDKCSVSAVNQVAHSIIDRVLTDDVQVFRGTFGIFAYLFGSDFFRLEQI